MSTSFHTNISAVRRSAKTVLDQRREHIDGLKRDQEKARNVMAEKTARLRALRLAKEDAEAAAAAELAASSPKPAPMRRRVRRSKQT